MDQKELDTKLSELDSYRGRTVSTERDRWRVDGDHITYRHGPQVHQVDEQVIKQAASLCGIPANYTTRLKDHPQMLASNLDYWFGQLGSVQLVTKGGELVAISHPTAPVVPAERVATSIDRTIHPTDYSRLSISPSLIEIFAVTQKENAVVPGDLVRAGVYVSFSPMGTVNPLVRGFIQRLVCTNGAMTSEQGMSFSFDGGGGDDEEKFLPWLRSSLKNALKEFRPEVKRLQEMSRHDIVPSEHIDHVMRSRLPESTRNLIRARIMDGDVRTEYDLYNVLTSVASHDVEDPRVAYRLMDAAPRVIDHRNCPVCHRNMN